jgi:uncharacterized membrane protein YkoI
MLVFPSPDTSLEAMCWETRTMAGGDAKSMLSSMRRPMFRFIHKSVLKSWLKSASALPTVAAIFAVSIFAVLSLAVPRTGNAAELHCLTGDEQRAAIAASKAVPLATAIHALHRAPKDVIKAQLCQEPERLIYMLTLLGRDGKVKRATVDATNGAVVGER